MAAENQRMSAKRPSWRAILEVGTSIVLMAAGIAVLWRHFSPPQVVPETGRVVNVPDAPVSLDGAARNGPAGAGTAILVYSDFECGFCKRFATEVWPALEREFVQTGQVALFFRHLPLPSHVNAMTAAVAAECAGAQGQFWPMHDRLFEQPNQLDESGVQGLAAGLGLDVKAFKDCLHGPTRDRVLADAKGAAALGISGTPAFLIGTRQADNKLKVRTVLSGLKPLNEFRKALTTTIAQADSPSGDRSTVTGGMALMCAAAVLTGIIAINTHRRRARAS
jgi:protein-disulfide isomerase